MKNIVQNLKAKYLAEFLILLIIGLTPLYFNYFYSTSIDLSKVLLFKALLFLLILVSVWRFSVRKITLNNKFIFSAWPLLTFFGALFLSLFFSVDINNSWFGLYTRNEGLTSYLFYGLWLILIVFNYNDLLVNKAKLQRLLITIAISGFLVSLYAIFQFLGIDAFTWSEPAYLTKRAFSSFGQPAYLATWLLMILPLSAYLIYIFRNWWLRSVFSLLFFINLIALFSTGSRSAFLIFFVISLVWLTGFLLLEKKYSKKYFLIIIGSVFSLFLIFVTALFIINPTRVTELTDLKKGSVNVRFELWQTGLQAFWQKPIFGYGLENQKEVYVKYYQPNWAIYSGANIYSDRAHNLILDTLLTSGLVGFVALVIFLWWIFKNLWQSYKVDNNKLAAFVIWSLILYLAVLMFNFSITVTNIYFFFLVALAWLFSGQLFLETEKRYNITASSLAIMGTIIVSIYGLIGLVHTLEGEYYFQETLSAISEKQYFKTLVLNDYLKESNPNPALTSYYGQTISLMLIQKLPTIGDKSSSFVVEKYLKNFGEDITSQGFEDQFVKAFIFGMTNNRLQSEEIFNRLALTSPYLPKIYLAWGDIYLFNNNPKKAIVKFEQAKSVLPDLNNIYLNNDQKFKLSNYYSLINNRIEQANKLLIK